MCADFLIGRKEERAQILSDNLRDGIMWNQNLGSRIINTIGKYPET